MRSISLRNLHVQSDHVFYFAFQVLERRSEAYGHAHHARGTHFSRESLDGMNREQAEHESSRSESHRSLSPTEEGSKGRKGQRSRPRPRSESPPRRREAWTEVRPRSPKESEDRREGSGTEATSDNEDMILERGRSPTPELRDARLSRRHHLDVTTNILNDSFEKSMSLSKKKKPSPSRSYGRGTPPREEKLIRPLSPASSVGLGDDARSYTPPRRGIPRKVDTSPPDPRRVSPPASVGGSGGGRDDDVLSVSAMSSRASTASETLERARKRRDEFWKQENASR